MKRIIIGCLGILIGSTQAFAQSKVLTVSPSTMAVTALPPIPAGNNVIGHVICDSGCSSSGSPSFGSPFSSTGTPIGFTDGTNMQAAKVFDLDTGGGVDYGLGVSIRIAANGSSIPVTAGAGATAPGTIRMTIANDAPQQSAATPFAFRASDGTSFIADAPIGGTPTSNPIPVACHFETTPTGISNTQTGMLECDNSQRLLTVGVPLAASYTDRSISLTTGGTSQTLMASNGSRKGYFIQNPCAAVESIFINFTAAASTTSGNSMELIPCASVTSGLGPLTTEAITVNAATTAHKVVAKEQ